MATPLSYRSFIAGCALLAALGLGARPAWGQAQAAPVAPVQGSIFGPHLETVEQTKPGELLTKLRYSQDFDTNVAIANGKQLYGSFGYAVGDFTYARQRARQAFLINYKVGGRIYSPKFSDLDTTSHDVRVQGSQQLTSRLSVNLFGRYSDVPSIGEFLPPLGPPVFPMFGNPEENIPFIARRSVEEQGALILDYRVDEHTSLNFGGNYRDVRYQPRELLHTRGYSPYASVFHSLSARQAVGAGYVSQWIEYPGHPARLRVDNFLATYSLAISHSFTISAYGGPGWAHLTSEPFRFLAPFHQTNLTLVGGAFVTKTFARVNKVTFDYSRAYTQSSQLLGASLRQAVSSNFTRSITPRLTLLVGGNYARETLGIAGPRNASSFRIQGGVHYRLNSRINFVLSEAYTDLLSQAFVGSQLRNRNLASVGVQFILPTVALEK